MEPTHVPIFFTIGRMNPPTPGHMFVIEQLILHTIYSGQQRFGIILSHTTKPPDKNPLTCEQKRRYLLSGMIASLKEQMKTRKYDPPVTAEDIDRCEPIIICMDDHQEDLSFGALNKPIPRSINILLRDFGYPDPNMYVKMVLIVGSDRSDSEGFSFIRDSLGRKNPPVESDIIGLPRNSSEVPEEDDENTESIPEAMSASYMRRLVKKGKREKFFIIMRQIGLSDPMINDMYQQLEDKLNIPEKVKKGTKKGGNKRRRSRRSRRYK
jgi:hypothetical protein